MEPHESGFSLNVHSESARIYCLTANVHGATMIMIPCEYHAYWQPTTKRMVWKEFIISDIIDWNTGIDANTSELDNGLYASDIYMSDETSEPKVDDSDREPLTGKAWNPSSLFNVVWERRQWPNLPRMPLLPSMGSSGRIINELWKHRENHHESC